MDIDKELLPRCFVLGVNNKPFNCIIDLKAGTKGIAYFVDPSDIRFISTGVFKDDKIGVEVYVKGLNTIKIMFDNVARSYLACGILRVELKGNKEYGFTNFYI
ncbi:hypothetical protein D3C71_1268250 [compost metagenome]